MSAINGTNGIITDNLSLLTNDGFGVSERRLVWLYERSKLLLRDESLMFGENRSEDFPALFDSAPIPEDIPNESRNYILAKQSEQALLDKLTVCILAAKEYIRPRPLLERLLHAAPYRRNGKIAYFRNVYADAAFRAFGEYLENPTVSYHSDFNTVCEETYYGRASMCLLPLDSSRDSKLVSFYKLMEKYELFPVYSCDVTAPEGATTRYALLAKSMSLPQRDMRTRENGCLFEFTLATGTGDCISDVLTAAKLCGLDIYKIDSLPSTYDEGSFTYDLVLSVSSPEELDAFVLFMTLCVPEYEPLGVYNQIRTEI